MRRGFKAQAERTSLALRKELGLAPHDPLPGRLLAEHKKITLLGVEDIPGLDHACIGHLLGEDVSDWSGFTLATNGRTFIVHNTSSPLQRQESDIMHEIAHIICEHPPGETLKIGSFWLRHYSPEEEEEAECMGGVLQIPKEGLMKFMWKDFAKEDIAIHFGCSVRMVTKRINLTGADKIVRRARRKQRYN